MNTTSTSPFKQIMVVGAGAVGGFFGAHLANTHPQVSFLLRPRTLAAVQERGLRILSAGGTLTVKPRAATDPRQLPSPDLIILGVKAYDLNEVMDQIAPVMHEKTIILTLQNGVSIEEKLMARFPGDHVVGGVAFIYSKIQEPGVIAHYKRGAVTIGELHGGESQRIHDIAALFVSAGLSCRVSRTILQAKWEKMCWNCVFNPLSVILNDRIATALDHPELSPVIAAIVQEVMAVARTRDVSLSPDMAEKIVQWSLELRDIHTSMYDDWKRGRSTEIDFLNGYIVEAGQAHGIATPVNETITALVKVLTHAGGVDQNRVLIDGAVVQQGSLNIREMGAGPLAREVVDVGQLANGMRGSGLRVRGVLETVTPDPAADHVTFHSRDGRWAASLTLEQAREYGVLVYEIDGNPLSAEQGGPVRLMAPGLGDLCANVKNVGRIELTCGPGKDTRPADRSC